jgi:trimethylamine:corrinoid methyltransferase-like protein
MSAALVEMGRFYGLPATAAGCTSDAHEPGPEAVLEKLVTMLPPALAGADVTIGFGEIEGDQALVLEQILVDDELARFCERLLDGIGPVEGEDLAAEALDVGPGGDFLARHATRRASRDGTFFAPAILGRHARHGWLELGSPSMYGTARERVAAILATPPADPLPDAAAAGLAEVLATADRALG